MAVYSNPKGGYRAKDLGQAFVDIYGLPSGGAVCMNWTSGTNQRWTAWYFPNGTINGSTSFYSMSFWNWGSDYFVPISYSRANDGTPLVSTSSNYSSCILPEKLEFTDTSVWFPLAGLVIFIFICFLVYRIFLRRALP